MNEAKNDSVTDVDAAAMDVRRAIRGISIDRFVIEAVLDSYLFEVTKKDVVAGDDLMTRMEEDDKYLAIAHNAVLDGLAFSTFVGTLDDEAYVASLEELTCFGEPELEEMRLKIFDFGVGVACQSIGGSPTTGKTAKRMKLFHERLVQLQQEFND